MLRHFIIIIFFFFLPIMTKFGGKGRIGCFDKKWPTRERKLVPHTLRPPPHPGTIPRQIGFRNLISTLMYPI